MVRRRMRAAQKMVACRLGAPTGSRLQPARLDAVPPDKTGSAIHARMGGKAPKLAGCSQLFTWVLVYCQSWPTFVAAGCSWR